VRWCVSAEDGRRSINTDGYQTLTDLNDFITPSQACIKPVEEVKPEEIAKQPGAASVSTKDRSFESRLTTM
jgi:hypothetical protein